LEDLVNSNVQFLKPGSKALQVILRSLDLLARNLQEPLPSISRVLIRDTHLHRRTVSYLGKKPSIPVTLINLNWRNIREIKLEIVLHLHLLYDGFEIRDLPLRTRKILDQSADYARGFLSLVLERPGRSANGAVNGVQLPSP